MKKLLALLLVGSLATNIFLSYELNQTHIRPRKNKDMGIEMKNKFSGSYDEVILVYGYMENYPAAKEILEHVEKTAGREPGSFRIKIH
jgi:hypothetical protein